MQQAKLTISGMSCGHCVSQVATALRSVQGVTVNDVGVGSAAISYDPEAVSEAAILETVAAAGYGARIAGPQD